MVANALSSSEQEVGGPLFPNPVGTSSSNTLVPSVIPFGLSLCCLKGKKGHKLVIYQCFFFFNKNKEIPPASPLAPPPDTSPLTQNPLSGMIDGGNLIEKK